MVQGSMKRSPQSREWTLVDGDRPFLFRSAKPSTTLLSNRKRAFILAAFLTLVSVPLATPLVPRIAEGLWSLTWKTTTGTWNDQGSGYIFPGPDGTPVAGQRYTAWKPSPSFGDYDDLFKEAVPPFHLKGKSILIHIHPTRPDQSLLHAGVPIQAVHLLFLLSALLFPAFFLWIRVLRRDKTAALSQEQPRNLWIAFSLFLGSFILLFPLLSLWSIGFHTLPPSWPFLTLWLCLSSGILYPKPWLRLYRIPLVQRILFWTLVWALTPLLLAVIGFTFPAIAIAVMGTLLVLLFLYPFLRPEATTPFSLLFLSIWIPTYIAGLISPSRAFFFFLYQHFPDISYYWFLPGTDAPRFGAMVDLYIAISGIVFCMVTTILDTIWRARQAMQVENLPTARSRSAAPGIAEFKGTARSLPENRGNSILYYNSSTPSEARIRSFYLEDESGQILVDPRGAYFRIGRASSLAGRVCEIVLTRRVQKSDLTHPHIMELRDGDPVYVVGNVQENPDAGEEATDSDRLVVKPLVEPVHVNPLWQLLFAKLHTPPRRDIQHVFFLSDTTENRAERLIRRGILHVWLTSLFWILPCLWMIGAQVPRVGQDRSAWTIEEIIQFAPESERIPLVRERLIHPEPRQRRKAVEYLADTAGREDPSFAPALIPLLLDPDRGVRRTTADVLYRIKVDHSASFRVPFILKTLRTGSVELKRLAAFLLRKTGGDPGAVVPALARALSDENHNVRANAAWSISYIGWYDKPSLEKLVQCLEDPDSEVREAATHAIVQLPLPPDQGLPIARQMFHSGDPILLKGAARSIKRYGEDGSTFLPELADLLNHDDSGVRLQAVVAMGAIHNVPPSIVQNLLPLLNDPETGVRQFTVETLGKIGVKSREVLDALLDTLNDRATWVRREAVGVLGKLGTGDPEVIRRMGDLLRDSDERVRMDAVHNLSGIGKDALPAMNGLTAALTGSDDRVREEAASVLGDIGPAASEAAPVLLACLKDENTRIRQAAIRALGRIQPNNPLILNELKTMLDSATDPSMKNEIRMTLQQVLNTPQRRAALAVLARKGVHQPEDLPSLLFLLSDYEESVRAASVSAIGDMEAMGAPAYHELRTHLNDPSPPVRARTCIALGKIPSFAGDSIGDIADLLSDPDSYVRLCAAQSLAAFGPELLPVRDKIAKALRDPDHSVHALAARALASSGSPEKSSLSSITRLMKDQNPECRRNALKVATSMGIEAVSLIPAIIALLQDPDYHVRRYAAEALGSMGPSGSPAVPNLILAIEDKEIQIYAIRALGSIGPPAVEAIPVLENLMSTHPPPYLQNEIRDALIKIRP